MYVSSLMALHARGRGIYGKGHQTLHGVTNRLRRRTSQESWAIVGNSPVFETRSTPHEHPSSAGSGKAGVNLPGPSGKAKYKHATDSALVP